MSRAALRALFYVGGVGGTAAGLWTVVAGARSLPRQRLANPVVESELRFYSAFYVAYGLWVLSVAPRADRDAQAVRKAAAALFLAGAARLGGWVVAGRPHRLQRVLLAIELGRRLWWRRGRRTWGIGVGRLLDAGSQFDVKLESRALRF